MVSALILGGARVEQVCLKKWTAMHEASRAGCAHVMELLLQSGGQVSETDWHGVTPLGIAAEYSHPEVLELLIKYGENIPHCLQMNPDLEKNSAKLSLMDECFLLSSLCEGADVNAQAPNGDSVLYDAAGSGNPDCIDILLQHGANPNHRNLSSQLPIHHAALEGHYL